MISQTFKNLKDKNRAALALFVTCGDPNIGFTERLVEAISKNGADIIELGVPFSDPMADGKTIQEASNRALKSQTNILQILDMVKRLREKGVKTPFIIFGYFNNFLQIGLEELALRTKNSGANAWLVADLPLEESGEVVPVLKENGLDFIAIASPTTPLKRVKKISQTGSGFLYYVTVAGVTGIRDKLPEGFAKRLKDVREVSELPVGAGFGISNFESAHLAAMNADCVIVGSKLVDLVYKTRIEDGENKAIENAINFVKTLSSAMQRD